jgi:hypothetical protein
MNWHDKIDFMIQEKNRVGYGGPYRIDIRYRDNSWQQNELETIIKPYTWLPKSYINFIKKYDNIGIAWVVFYGSEAGDIIPLGKEIEELREYGLSEDYFPFGKGPGGEVYAFNKQGEDVIEFPADDYEFEKPSIIATSLERFVEDCLMGKRYADFNRTENDRYYEFLKLQGWVGFVRQGTKHP